MKDLNELFKFSIINIDKPSDPTSFQVSDFIKKQLGLNKTSHFGTLDPKVTGVLPIALGHSVKLTGYFSKQDKEYIGTAHLHEDIDIKKISEIIVKKFLGKIKQLPPLKSRVKREEREREIKKFEILEKQEKDLLFLVECEAGTYIRKLIHDLGKELGIGMHMTELRRTRASIFYEKDSTSLYDFVKAVEEWKNGNTAEIKKMLIPIGCVKKIMPSIFVNEKAIEKLKHGSPIFKKMFKKHENFSAGDFIAVFFEDKLIEIAKSEVNSNKIEQLKQEDIIAKPETVLPR